MKHTQDEWELSKDKKGVTVNGKLIATCWPVNDTDDTRLIGESWLDMRARTAQERLQNNELEPQANAKLIAAAPELLDALQSLMNVYETKGQLLSFDVNIARNAIKKATE